MVESLAQAAPIPLAAYPLCMKVTSMEVVRGLETELQQDRSITGVAFTMQQEKYYSQFHARLSAAETCLPLTAHEHKNKDEAPLFTESCPQALFRIP